MDAGGSGVEPYIALLPVRSSPFTSPARNHFWLPFEFDSGEVGLYAYSQRPLPRLRNPVRHLRQVLPRCLALEFFHTCAHAGTACDLV